MPKSGLVVDFRTPQPRGQPLTRRCQQQRELGIGMRGSHMPGPFDLPAPARDDLNRDRP